MSDSYYELDPDGDVNIIVGASFFTPGEIVETIDERSTETPDATQTREEISDAPVRMRASSKHLMLASPVFKAIFQTRFNEGQRLSSDGHIELPLPDDNPTALLILLKLIHGKFREVPLEMSVSMLTELAILVDKYELSETTEIILNHWYPELDADSELYCTTHLLSLICISWVFKRPTHFKEFTKRAQLENEGVLESERLPIPEKFLKKINQSRNIALAKLFEYLQSILKTYLDNPPICTQGRKCNGMMLGCLSIGLNELGIFQTPPAPYDGISVEEIFGKLRILELPQFCSIKSSWERDHSNRMYNQRYDQIQNCRGIREQLKERLAEIEQTLQGLDLTEEIAA